MGQALFIAVALTDLIAGPGTLWKRISSPARTVVSLLAATACAVAIFFVPAQKLWKPTQIQVVRKGSRNNRYRESEDHVNNSPPALYDSDFYQWT